jgi:hypothetical protein
LINDVTDSHHVVAVDETQELEVVGQGDLVDPLRVVLVTEIVELVGLEERGITTLKILSNDNYNSLIKQLS